MWTVSVDLSELHRDAVRTVQTLQEGTRAATQKAAEEGAAFAKLVGPFQDRTGNLRGNIVAQFVASDGYSVVWEILSPMYYSKFVDRGTSRSKPYPFMGPAQVRAEAVLAEQTRRVVTAVERIWR